MAIAFVGAGTGVATTTGVGTVSKAGCTAGNIILVHTAARGVSDDFTIGTIVNLNNIAGAAGLDELVVGSGTAPGILHQVLIGRVIANGTVSVNQTVGASGEDIFGRIYEFSGVSTATTGLGLNTVFENDAQVLGRDVAGGSSTSVNFGGSDVVTNGANRLAMVMGAIASNQTIANFTGETGGDLTQPVAAFSSATGALCSTFIQTAPVAAAGSVANGAFAVGVSTDWVVATFALIPGAAATAPTAPQSPTATPGNAQVVLGWSAPASNGGSVVTGYKIYRSLTTGTETLLASPAGTGTAYTDSAVSNGTAYFYKISAVNAIGESVLSSEVTATPTAGATVPTAPLGLAATPGNAQVGLTWSAPASNGGSAITAYKIYRSTTSGAETLLATPAGTGVAYTDSTTVNGTTYYYKVSAVNAIGESALSGESSATPIAPVAVRTFKRLYGPTLLTNVATTLYTCPASTIAVVRHVHVSNPSASTVDFTLSIGTNAAGTRLWDGYPVPADDVLDHYQDFSLAAGEFLQAVAGVGAILNLTIDGYEVGAAVTPPPPPAPIPPSDTLFPSDTSP